MKRSFSDCLILISFNLCCSVKEALIKGAAIDYAARKSVTERGDNRFNQRFLKLALHKAVGDNCKTEDVYIYRFNL